METVLYIMGGLSLIALGIAAIVKRHVIFGFFGDLDRQEHTGVAAIIVGVILILIGMGLIIYQIALAIE